MVISLLKFLKEGENEAFAGLPNSCAVSDK